MLLVKCMDTPESSSHSPGVFVLVSLNGAAKRSDLVFKSSAKLCTCLSTERALVSVLLKITLRAVYLDLEGPDTKATSSSSSSSPEESKETMSSSGVQALLRGRRSLVRSASSSLFRFPMVLGTPILLATLRVLLKEG